MKHLAWGFVVLALAPACGRGTIRGDIEEKLSPTEAVIDLGSEKVSVGDRVTIYENQCVYPGRARREVMGPWCDSKVRRGEATVVRVVDAGTAVIEVDPGVTFRRNMDVEIKKPSRPSG